MHIPPFVCNDLDNFYIATQLKRTVRKADIEEAIMRKTVSYIFDKDIMDGIVSRVLQWQKHENTTLPLLQRELVEIEKSLSNVMAAIEQGIINPTIKKRMDELTEQKTDLESRSLVRKFKIRY